MKPKEQRIAIAESCPHVCHKSLNEEVGYCWNNGTPWAHSEFDPLNDLNAMHGAEKVLTEQQFQTYLDWLDVSCGGELELSAMIDGPAFGFSLVHATAAQRAEAFLRTLNLWKP